MDNATIVRIEAVVSGNNKIEDALVKCQISNSSQKPAISWIREDYNMQYITDHSYLRQY